MTPRCRVSASPATADKKASTLVLTGGAVSYIIQRDISYIWPAVGSQNEILWWLWSIRLWVPSVAGVSAVIFIHSFQV